MGREKEEGLGQRKDRGAALIVTLLVITTLVGLAVGFSDESGIEVSLSAYARDGYRAQAAATGAYAYVLGLLNADENASFDSLHEDWAKVGSEGALAGLYPVVGIQCRVVDENSKVNINALRTQTGGIEERGVERVRRLLEALGMGEEHLNPILDWLDEDDHTRLDGAEALYYKGLDPPYSCANGPFLTPSQIYLVRNVQSGAGKKRLEDYFTVYTDGKININTASREVLQSLDESLDESLAEAILAYRAEEDFKAPGDLMKVPGMTAELYQRIAGLLTVSSSAFSIEILGKCGESSARVRAVVRRLSNAFSLVYWQVS